MERSMLLTERLVLGAAVRVFVVQERRAVVRRRSDHKTCLPSAENSSHSWVTYTLHSRLMSSLKAFGKTALLLPRRRMHSRDREVVSSISSCAATR